MSSISALSSEPQTETKGEPTESPEVAILPPRMRSLRVTIQSTTVQQPWVRPGGSVTITVTGTVTVKLAPGDEQISSPTVVVVFAGGATQTVTVGSNGSWSCTGAATGSTTGAFSNTAYGSVDYSFVDPETGNTTTDTATGMATFNVTVPLDSAPPVVTFSPPNGFSYECPAPGGTVPVEVSGTANDDKSGVGWVKVGLAPNNLATATPLGSWASWTATVNVPATIGAHTIYVQAEDNVGNSWNPAQDPSKQLTLTLVDTTAPVVTVSVPPGPFLYDNSPVSIPVSGTVLDTCTGVNKVWVRLVEDAGESSEQEATVSDPHGPNQTANWNTTLQVSAPGKYTVSVRASDNNAPANATASPSPYTAPVVVVQVPEPIVTATKIILSNGSEIPIPASGTSIIIPGTEEGANISISGTASAPYSIVTTVEVSVDNGLYQQVDQHAPDWSQWRATTVHVPAQGSHTITVRCTNGALNPDRKYGYATVTLTVGVAYRPHDIEDNTSLLAYFRTLLEFAKKRILITVGTASHNVTLTELAQQFHQPFDRLQTDEEVQQIRICVEVLRAYLAASDMTLDPAAEAVYCRTAYQALLTQFGTSYDELRLARRADPAKRQALAARLGIDLDATNQLDQLFLTPEQITEANLEHIFGLADTARDPLAPAALPLLFTWQMNHLRTLWWKQDHPDPTSPGVATLAPIIDPDIVSQDNLAMRTESNLAYQLWTTRRNWIDDQLTTLANEPAGENDQDRLDRLVGKVIAPATMSELLELETDRQQGHNITEQLAQYHFNLPAFTFLIHLRNTAVDSLLLPSEWDDLYSILVQVMKVREYDTWRTEETSLILGPDSFIIATNEPQLPVWRATRQTRQTWRDTLQGRINQQEATRKAFLAAVSAAETVALPTLRDALVETVSTSTEVDVANWLTERLMLDVKGSSSLPTTRLTQAIETAQSILTALRNGRFMEMDSQLGPIPPGLWTLTEPNAAPPEVGAIFDQEQMWMGSYASWRAAMRIFLYPENILLPNLREDMTAQFQAMLTAFRNGPQITPQLARNAATTYLDAVEGNQQIRDALNNLNGNWKADTFVLDESMEETDLLARAAAIQTLLISNNGTQPLQRYLTELFYFVPMHLALQLHQVGQYTAALDWFRTVYGYNLPVGQRKVYYGLTQEETIPSVYQTTDQWLRTTLNPHDIAPQRAGAFTRFTIISIVRCFLDYADAEFSTENGETIARARTFYLGALGLLDSADMRLPNTNDDPAVHFGFASNPQPQVLRMHAAMNLFKLRDGRNIAGMQRQVTSYASQNRVLISEAAAASSLQPTPYRYSTLIDRAKQLVALAQQMEERYLSALEKRDAETYNLIKARHDLGLTQATVQLQDLRVIEADDSVSLATLQKSRAQIQADHYDQLLNEPMSGLEMASLALSGTAAGLQLAAAATSFVAAVAPASVSFSVGFPPSASVSVSSSPQGSLSAIASGLSSGAAAASTTASITATLASYERRKQEWELQKSITQKDIAIGQQQFAQAQHHRNIAIQERVIAQMQANHAQATVDFLANKFTNAELYHWMSGILGGVYNYFLQQATAIARLAQSQLAFERQEKPPAVIRADYWQVTPQVETPSSGNGQAPDRRGLTGSARLLQDIYQLDQYAFETNKRKLQLSKTISLAQLAPIEFQNFRQTGVLPFTIPMALFDRDFPGHYLRMIRRVQTSLVALIPPNQGIRATLATTGLSRVVIADGDFRSVVVRRDPEVVALTSPLNAAGLFELDVQSELLLPFEMMGVDSSWELTMPKAANPFDYRTIADVLFTIEYTALNSFDYRQQVIQQLDRNVSADRAFSFRQQLADQWYDLHNPGQSATPMTVRFKTAREDFPPNIDDQSLKIQHVVLCFVRADGASPLEVPVTHLQFTVPGSQPGTTVTIGGGATTIDGVISTRRGNAANWAGMIGQTPLQEWELALPNTPELKNYFVNEKIEDILFVITYSGRTPEWPA